MQKAAAAFSRFTHSPMKIRPILMLGWLLGLAAATGQEAKPAAEADVPPPEVMPEDSRPLTAQEEPRSPEVPGIRERETRDTMRVRLEVWEMDAKKAAAKLDATPLPAELEAWRKELLTDPASVLASSQAVTVEAKSRASVDSILERIYPTEYEPPEFPTNIPTSDGFLAKLKPLTWPEWAEAILGHATPTSYETRDTGTTFEAAVQPVKAEAKCWDISIGLESVQLVAMENFGAKVLDVTMPAISSFKTGGLLRVEEGKWQLVSVQEPPRGMDSKSTGKSWITLVRVDRAR